MRVRSIFYSCLTVSLVLSEAPATGMWCLHLILCCKKKHHETFPANGTIAPLNSPASLIELHRFNQLKERQISLHNKKKFALQLTSALNNSSDNLNKEILERQHIQYCLEEQLPITIQTSPQKSFVTPAQTIPSIIIKYEAPNTKVSIIPLRCQKAESPTSQDIQWHSMLIQRELNDNEQDVLQEFSFLKQEYTETQEDLYQLRQTNLNLTQKHTAYLAQNSIRPSKDKEKK